jgi:hypothetical protein
LLARFKAVDLLRIFQSYSTIGTSLAKRTIQETNELNTKGANEQETDFAIERAELAQSKSLCIRVLNMNTVVESLPVEHSFDSATAVVPVGRRIPLRIDPRTIPMQDSPGAVSDDRDLERRVISFLETKHVPTLRHVTVKADAGVVTLSGQVHTFYEKQLCNQCCRRVAGVRQLLNEVIVIGTMPGAAVVA